MKWIFYQVLNNGVKLMKKIILIFTLLFFVIKADAAMSFKDAFEVNDTKPMAVLIYADWADGYENSIVQFRNMQRELGSVYNYVELDIANEDAKYYTEQNTILTKLPYIMLYRGKCKFARFIERGCALDTACSVPKMKSFIRQ